MKLFGFDLFEMIKLAIFRLTPSLQMKNPLMFITYIGTIITLIASLRRWDVNVPEAAFLLAVSFLAGLSVLLGNLAEVIAEQGGKERGRVLRKTQENISTCKVVDGKKIKVSSADLQKGDVIFCQAGEIIPADGYVIEGAAMVDESAITGESAPVMRETGALNSTISAGTKVVSNALTIRVTSEAGRNFLDQMIEVMSGMGRRNTAQESALQVLLLSFSFILFLVIASLKGLSFITEDSFSDTIFSRIMIFVVFLCLVPMLIPALADGIIITGIERLIQKGVMTKSEQSLESVADADLVIFDKTGTVTIGNRRAEQFFPILGIDEKILAKTAMMASISDTTPEGRSIVALAKSQYGLWEDFAELKNARFIPFTPETRMSGIDLNDPERDLNKSIRKGAVDAIKKYVGDREGIYYAQIDGLVKNISYQGATPLLVCDDSHIIGVIKLTDAVKGGINECCEGLRDLGIKTLLVTGDNPLTAASVAASCGIEDYAGSMSPEAKLDLIKQKQKNGYFVVMVGDGNDDAPSLAQADIGITMNTGTETARDAGNMVDLDSHPKKVLDIILTAKQVLITRGLLGVCALTASIVKYMAIFPVMLGAIGAMGDLEILNRFNVLKMSSFRTAVLSCLILNIIDILLFMPLALKGVKITNAHHRVDKGLTRKMFLFGLGSFILSLVVIKFVDTSLALFGI